jgi:hypothetical protein
MEGGITTTDHAMVTAGEILKRAKEEMRRLPLSPREG